MDARFINLGYSILQALYCKLHVLLQDENKTQHIILSLGM